MRLARPRNTTPAPAASIKPAPLSIVPHTSCRVPDFFAMFS